MASTSKTNRAISSGKSNQASPKRSPKSPPQPNKPKGSMGLGLLLIAIGTSLIGLGGLGYWFYQELLSSARREVDTSAEAQTRQIEAKLLDVRQTVDEVASGAKILFQQPSKPKGYEPYQRLIVDGLQNKKSIAGMGIASNGSFLFPPAKPLVPYVWKEQSGLKTETSGQKLAAPNDKLLSGDRPDIQKATFYQDTLKGKASWSQPYTALGKTIITYSAPISDGQKVVGIVNADAIASEILSLIDTASYQEPSNESKIGFVVASSSGKVVTASAKFQSMQTQNPAIAESLTSLVQQAKAKPSGTVQTGGNLWAYRKIEGSDLLFVAQLPESEITNKLMLPFGVAAVSISAILAIAILSFVSALKKRLKPLTEECDRYLSQQGNSGANVGGKDEIDHLGLSLKNTFQQIKTNEISLRSAAPQSSTPDDDISAAAQIQQSFAETELMEAEVGNLLDVVSSMEEGDLTIEAQVNDRATGLVADTLNRLREKLVEIISSVLGTAKQVAQGAADLEELAKTVVLNTAEQAQSVAQGQALTEQVAAIAERSSAQVNVANQSLQEVRDTVASGQTAINTLTDSISVLQTGSAQIVQRMKTLGEFVGLAEQFVQDQGQIASLTQVLALNATLVAARAADQKDPKQFSSVAREFESIAGQVNDLATQTNDGLTVLQQRTSQIQTVVTAIDAEVQNLSGLVAGFTSGVESSQSAFNSIQMATEEVVQIGQTISESSTEIADAAVSTASYMSEIAQLADRTADLTRSARQQAEAMGNQAQQLLQGIQFFRLPDSSGQLTPDTSVNSLLDSSTESINTVTNRNLGVVVPAIAVAAAVTAVSFSQSEQALPNEYESADHEDNTATDNRYLENLLDDEVSSDLIEDNAVESPQEQSFDSISENFMSGDITDRQNQDSATYSNLTDISLIEESLLADLKQEVYEDSDYSEDSDDTEPTLKNQMEGVNEFSIVEASIDPMIVSATSSFLEDTAFGAVTPLNEDANLSLPTFVDFSIPDMDDDDFIIPKMNIESTLDDSNSFFNNDNSIQAPEFNQVGVDFDPFAMDDQTVFQTIGDDDDAAIANNDNVFELTESAVNVLVSDLEAEDLEESHPEATDDELNYGLSELSTQIPDIYLEQSSDEEFSEEFNFEIDDDPLTNYADSVEPEHFFDPSPNQENEGFEEIVGAFEDQVNDYIVPAIAPELEIPSPSIDLSDQPSTEFTFEINESLSMESSDLVELDDFSESNSDSLFDSSPIDESEGFIADPFDSSANIQDDDPLVLEPQAQEFSSLDLPDEQLEDLSSLFNAIEDDAEINLADQYDQFGLEQNEADSLVEQADELDSIWQTEESVSDESDFSAIFDTSMIAADEQVSEPFDISMSFQEEDSFAPEIAIASETDIQESPMLDLSSQQLEDISDDLADELSEDFSFEIEDDLSTDQMDLGNDVFDAVYTLHPEAEDISVSSLIENGSELAFSSLIDESENLEDQSSEAIWETDEFSSSVLLGITDIQEELAEGQASFVTDSLSSTFALPDLSLTEEIDDALMDDEFNFDISDDDDKSGVSTSSLEQESDAESIKFSEIMDAENFADNATESMPDLSLDFSDDWLDEIAEENDASSAKFANADDDISIGYPSEDEVSAILDGDIYGFADNLLDSLMDESDEEFDSLSMDLPDLQTLPHLPNFNNEPLETEDSNSELESEPEFDFSAFDSTEDSINSARAEIDDFLSGSLKIEEIEIEKKTPTKPVEPDNSGSV